MKTNLSTSPHIAVLCAIAVPILGAMLIDGLYSHRETDCAESGDVADVSSMPPATKAFDLVIVCRTPSGRTIGPIKAEYVQGERRVAHIEVLEDESVLCLFELQKPHEDSL